jgi:hypothetical protein
MLFLAYKLAAHILDELAINFMTEWIKMVVVSACDISFL